MPPPRSVGLYHFAIELEELPALADAFRVLQAAGMPVQVANHGISLALYFTDPDGNGIELYVDTRSRRSLWQGIDEPVDYVSLLGAGSSD